MLKNYIFGLFASILILPTAVQAQQRQVVIKTVPVNTHKCTNVNKTPVAVSGTPQNITITQRRVVRGAGQTRTEVYQSTTTSTTSTSNTASRISPMCVLPPGVMNNVLITP
jgi:hypothetical protein